MKIVGLDHVQLAMPPGGETDARAFYAEILGLLEIAKPTALAARGGCWFTGGANVHVGPDEDFRPARKAHPALLVEDLDATRQALAAAGIAWTDDEANPGVQRLYADDPFGNRIEFIAARVSEPA